MKPLHELNALCAEKVAGWAYWQSKHGHWHVMSPEGVRSEPLFGYPKFDYTDGSEIKYNWYDRADIPSYTTDPAAVLGLLEKEGYRCTGNRCGGTAATIVQVTNAHPEKGGPEYFEGQADDSMISADNTFALAATLALLKAHGCEVGE